MEDQELQSWLRAALDEGIYHSQGSFSLDCSAAARKFGEYALTDPLQVVARLLRAAFCASCSWAAIQLGRRETSVTLVGYLSGVQQLGQCFDQVLSSQPEEREFSLAVNSLASQDSLRELTIVRAESMRVARLHLSGPERQVQLAEAYDLNQQHNFTHLSWKEKRNRSPSEDEQRLREWFRYSPLPISINGKMLDMPFGKPRGPGMLRHLGAARQILIKGPWYQPASYFWGEHHALEFRLFHPDSSRNQLKLPTPGQASCRLGYGHPGPHQLCFLCLACLCDRERQSQVEWVYRGQTVLVRSETLPLSGLSVVVTCEGLPFDVVGEKPVEGPALAARSQLIRDWVNVLDDFLVRHYGAGESQPVHRVLFDSRLCKASQSLPQTPRIRELMLRLSPA